jgi:hypothetical protein
MNAEMLRVRLVLAFGFLLSVRAVLGRKAPSALNPNELKARAAMVIVPIRFIYCSSVVTLIEKRAFPRGVQNQGTSIPGTELSVAGRRSTCCGRSY